MLKRITTFFESTMSVTVTDNADNAEHKKQMAAAALFIEVLKSDYEHRDEEWAAVETALHDLFGLSSDEITQITDMAEDDMSGNAASARRSQPGSLLTTISGQRSRSTNSSTID